MKLSSILSKNQDFTKTFIGQNPDEEIIVITRRGFILEIIWLLPVTLGYYFIFFTFYFDFFFGNIFTLSFISFLKLFLFLVLSNISINKITDWFYSINIVTNQRILDFDFDGLGVKNIVETDLRNIQSVTIESSGFLSFVFGLSSIKILTSGDNPNIELESIPGADKVQDIISDLTRSTNKNERIK